MMQDTGHVTTLLDILRDLTPVVSALLMGLVAWFLQRLNAKTAANSVVVQKAADAAGTAATAAGTAATAAQDVASVVVADGAKRDVKLEEISATGKLTHTAVNSNLTAWKKLGDKLAASDAALRAQLIALGHEPIAPAVDLPGPEMQLPSDGSSAKLSIEGQGSDAK
jgi:hypothetical protein